MLLGEEKKKSEIASRDKELIELRMRMKRIENELEELRGIFARLDKKSVKKEKKEKKYHREKKMVKDRKI